MGTLEENYHSILKKVEEKLRILGKPTHSVRLLAVSKGQPPDKILKLSKLGQVDFAENYAQELIQKTKHFISSPKNIQWHFIGHLQSNKIKDLVGHISLFHSIDTLSLAQKLNQISEQKQVVSPLLLQINLAEEASKSGIYEKEIETLVQALNPLRFVLLKGLMLIPPHEEDHEKNRPYFRRLKEILFDLNRKSLYKKELAELSMGMSDDYLIAIEEGSTWLRIGTALFGPRPLKTL